MFSTFDGNEHTISNLTITGNNNKFSGLFGDVVFATIKNVTVVNANISGNLYVGGIAGSNSHSTIENCAVSGNISGNESVGGIGGYNNGGTVKNSFSSTKISCDNQFGAIIGDGGGTFSGNEYASNVGDSTGAIKWLTNL